MGAMASHTASLTIAYSTLHSGADQRKHQSSVSLAFVRGIHRWPVNSPQKGPVTRKMFPFDDVIMDAKNSFKQFADAVPIYTSIHVMNIYWLYKLTEAWLIKNDEIQIWKEIALLLQQFTIISMKWTGKLHTKNVSKNFVQVCVYVCVCVWVCGSVCVSMIPDACF